MEFVLLQYYITCKINQTFKELNSKEQEKWKRLGPLLRRALKYIAEKITMIDPKETPEVM